MGYIGQAPANKAITSADIEDGIVIAADIADDAITLAKMASGTDGNVISYDASGNPVAIATGNDGQVLTSAGAGQPPAFEASAGFDVTSITGATALAAEPAATDEMVISDAGTLKRLDMTHMMNTPCVKFDNSAAITCATGAETMLYTNNTSRFNVGGTLTTGGRWTPGVAGWYFCCAWIQLDACTDAGEQAALQLWKNGASYYGDGTEKHFGFQTNTEFNMNSNIVLYLDADDYIEYKLWHNAGEDCDTNGDYNSVQAWRILGAA